MTYPMIIPIIGPTQIRPDWSPDATPRLDDTKSRPRPHAAAASQPAANWAMATPHPSPGCRRQLHPATRRKPFVWTTAQLNGGFLWGIFDVQIYHLWIFIPTKMWMNVNGCVYICDILIYTCHLLRRSIVPTKITLALLPSDSVW